MTLLFVALALALTGSVQQNGAASDGVPAKSASGQAQVAGETLPVSLERIQRAIAQEPAIRLKDQDLNGDRPVFRVEILGEKLTIEDILGPDYLKGPVPYGGMTHQEFLDMVTPEDVKGYAAFSNKEGAVVAATSLALQWALQKAIHDFKQARDERELEAARREVREALAELRKARREAGLPDR